MKLSILKIETKNINLEILKQINKLKTKRKEF